MSVTPHELVANLGSLPPISHVVSQVLLLTADTDCSFQKEVVLDCLEKGKAFITGF